MPPLAASKAPRRSWVAPVKAPFSWPKSSLSTSSAGMEPQSTTTKGPEARGLAWWSASATNSLPVPLSPSMSTVASVAARRASWANRARITALSPTSPPKRGSGCRGSTSRVATREKRTVVPPKASVEPSAT